MTTSSRRVLRYIGTALISILFWSFDCRLEAFAQRPLRNLSGIVSDQHRIPLEGAIVQVRNLDTNGITSYVTGIDGRYSFKRLDGDADYRISAKVRGHRSKTRSLSIFDSSKPKRINLIISFE